ncbi:hypothetical protein PV761_03400 [Arthrobacter sp. CC3]|uniref:hypothetical protein n=1 Tax=Arthrobacter sp. CC3 TaxID=3029185 RepID=UPI0032665524
MNGFSKAQKIAISARDLGCIIHGAGGDCVGDLLHHHRKGRGHGGVKSRNRVANGLLVCSRWNTLVEAMPDLATQARKNGWKLRTDHEIDTLPVWIPKLGRFVYLDDNGHYLDMSHTIITSQEAA